MRYQLSHTGVRTNVSEMMGLPTRAVVECVRFHALMPILPPNRTDSALRTLDLENPNHTAIGLDRWTPFPLVIPFALPAGTYHVACVLGFSRDIVGQFLPSVQNLPPFLQSIRNLFSDSTPGFHYMWQFNIDPTVRGLPLGTVQRAVYRQMQYATIAPPPDTEYPEGSLSQIFGYRYPNERPRSDAMFPQARTFNPYGHAMSDGIYAQNWGFYDLRYHAQTYTGNITAVFAGSSYTFTNAQRFFFRSGLFILDIATPLPGMRSGILYLYANRGLREFIHFRDPVLSQINPDYSHTNSTDSFPSGFDINNSAHYGNFFENRYLVIGGTPALPLPTPPSSVSSNIEAHRRAYTVPVYGVIVASTQPI
jgi:hypothetical protein